MKRSVEKISKMALCLVGTLTLMLSLNISAQVTSEERIEHIENELQKAHIPGISIARITNGAIEWHHALGYANADTQIAVTDDTVFEAASLSKPVLAYIVWRFVEEGKLSLDQPLHTLLKNPRFADKAAAEKITARLILSHQTGLPNWGGESLSFNFAPGDGFGYSGEGYVYLQNVVETISGKDFETLAQEMVFTPLGMENSRFTWTQEQEFTLASAHDRAANPVYRWIPDANAAASLHTTAKDYATFLAHLSTKMQQHASPFSESQIALKGDERGGEPLDQEHQLGWGLGWGIDASSTNNRFWHWGDNGVFRAFVAFEPLSGEGLVYFANSQNGLAVSQVLMDTYFSSMPAVFTWLGYPQSSEPLWQTEQAGYIAEEEQRYLDAVRNFAQVVAAFPDHQRLATRILWLQDFHRATASPKPFTDDTAATLVGQYGPRTLSWENGKLFYQRGQGARFEVIQLDNGMLGLQRVISFRLSVERDSTGTATKLIGHYVEGGKDESPRTTQATSD